MLTPHVPTKDLEALQRNLFTLYPWEPTSVCMCKNAAHKVRVDGRHSVCSITTTCDAPLSTGMGFVQFPCTYLYF